MSSWPLSRFDRPATAVVFAVGWMALIFAMSSRHTVPTPPGFSAKLTSIAGHFSVYFVLAILLWWALSFAIEDGHWRYLVAWGLAVLYGVSDEWHQSFVPGRTPDVFDVATDAAGAAVGLAILWWFSRTRLWHSDDAEVAEQ